MIGAPLSTRWRRDSQIRQERKSRLQLQLDQDMSQQFNKLICVDVPSSEDAVKFLI